MKSIEEAVFHLSENIGFCRQNYDAACVFVTQHVSGNDIHSSGAFLCRPRCYQIAVLDYDDSGFQCGKATKKRERLLPVSWHREPGPLRVP
jgi:hypothetical protein